MTYEEKLRRFREEKERQEQKKKEKQKKHEKEYQAAYRKAHGHKTRKQQARERLIKQKRLEKEREVRENERLERLMFIEQRTISVYCTKWYEREMPEEEMYTKEQLLNPPPEETGRLSERYWALIDEVKKIFEKKF